MFVDGTIPLFLYVCAVQVGIFAFVPTFRRVAASVCARKVECAAVAAAGVTGVLGNTDACLFNASFYSYVERMCGHYFKPSPCLLCVPGPVNIVAAVSTECKEIAYSLVCSRCAKIVGPCHNHWLVVKEEPKVAVFVGAINVVIQVAQ